MRIIISLSFSLLISVLSGQKNNFVGHLLLNNNQVIPYSLDLSIDSNYAVFGRSFFGPEGSAKTSDIEGQFNPEDNSIFLKELNVDGDAKTCPIFIQARVSHLINNIFVIAGIYRSSDSLNCGIGHINVVNRNFSFKLYKKPEPKSIATIENDSLNHLALKTMLEKNLYDDVKFLPVTAKDISKIATSSKSIKIRVYDQMKIDQDMVKIIFNKQTIDDIELTGKKQEFTLNAHQGENILTIQAINEGTIPMNTSKMEVECGEKTHYFINKIYKGQKTTYVINVQ